MTRLIHTPDDGRAMKKEGEIGMHQSLSAYANFKKFAIRYDLQRHSFNCWYAPYGLAVECAGMEKVVLGNESFSLKDYGNVSFSHVQHDDATTLVIKYCNGPACQPEFGIRFTLSDKGINCAFMCRGDLDVHLRGNLRWGADAENETFAVNLNRHGQDLRCAHGPASSLVDNALFDRKTDSAMEITGDCASFIQFDWENKGYAFRLNTGGHDYAKGFSLRFHERVYQGKFNIDYKPVNPNTTFKDPPVGWMTWYAVQFDAGEKTVIENAKWQAENLKDFGANTVWVDWEWYHNDFSGAGRPGVDIFHPDSSKYPNGLQSIAESIKSMGLIPALWIGAANDPSENEFVKEHPDTVLVKKASWCGQYFMDLSHPLVQSEYLPRVFQQILDWGYKALKWDCMPIQIQYCDNYHDQFSNPDLSTEQVMMEAVDIARKTVGKDYYMLYCAGLNDRDVNIASAGFDAARIGGDIFKWEDFIAQCVARVMKLYALHNVVFLNDPDNVILRSKFNTYDQALSRLSFVAMLGLPITFGDNFSDLTEDRVELLRRGIPPMNTHPMDIRATVHDCKFVIVNLAINKQYEQWNVVDVFNPLEQQVEAVVDLYSDLHLRLEDGPYFVYDFWNKAFVGEIGTFFTTTLRPCASKIFAVRRKLGRPQVLSTTRHFSQGAYDIVDMCWDEKRNVLSGISNVVAHDLYEIVVAVPKGLRMFVEGNDTCSANVQDTGDNLWTLSITPQKTGEMGWSVCFTPYSPH